MDLTRKYWYVAGGHLTDPLSSMTYTSVVIRDSVCIAFLVADINKLEIIAGDIKNAYLKAPTKEKDSFYTGYKWKLYQGIPVVIVRYLLVIKSSELACRNNFSDILGNLMAFKSTLNDPDVWLKPATASYGFKYYSYILVYVYEIIVVENIQGKYTTMI